MPNIRPNKAASDIDVAELDSQAHYQLPTPDELPLKLQGLTEDDPSNAIPTDRRPAAVLALTAMLPEPALLFTKRPDTMKSHGGQVAFPGGKVEANESILDAAIRETHEEVGIRPSAYKMLGPMRSFPTGGSDFWITPHLAVSQRRPLLVVDTYEVDEVFWVPWAQFADPARHKPTLIHGDQGRWVIDYWDVDTSVGRRTVWGATGAIMRSILEHVLDHPLHLPDGA